MGRMGLFCHTNKANMFTHTIEKRKDETLIGTLLKTLAFCQPFIFRTGRKKMATTALTGSLWGSF
jgi:hypothetical protein